jgi:hypothetical protein
MGFSFSAYVSFKMFPLIFLHTGMLSYKTENCGTATIFRKVLEFFHACGQTDGRRYFNGSSSGLRTRPKTSKPKCTTLEIFNSRSTLRFHHLLKTIKFI